MMNSLKLILQQKSKNSPLMRGITAAYIVESANQILGQLFGQEIINFASAAYVKNDTLYIACLSSTVAQEIKLREKDFLQSIKAKDIQTIEKINYLS